MRVLFDINILVDVALKREPFFAIARGCWNAVESGKITGTIASFSLPTVYYLCSQRVGHDKAMEIICACLGTFEIAPVTEDHLVKAVTLGLGDYEDALQIVAAMGDAVSAIVTRNARDFDPCPIPVYSPEELLEAIDKQENG